MTDPIDTHQAGEDDEWDMAAARARLKPKMDQSKRGRQDRQRKLAKSVDPVASDGRSLRATGRTAQYNFKIKPEIKAFLNTHIPSGKGSLWMEEAILAKLREEGIEIDA